MMNYIKGRAVEPSTWAGFAVLVEAVKVVFPQWAGVLVGLQTVFGGVAVMARESGR